MNSTDNNNISMNNDTETSRARLLNNRLSNGNETATSNNNSNSSMVTNLPELSPIVANDEHKEVMSTSNELTFNPKDSQSQQSPRLVNKKN